MIIERWYIEEFDPEIHESTAELQIVDLCVDCIGDYDGDLVEQEKMVPPSMECEMCGYMNDF